MIKRIEKFNHNLVYDGLEDNYSDFKIDFGQLGNPSRKSFLLFKKIRPGISDTDFKDLLDDNNIKIKANNVLLTDDHLSIYYLIINQNNTRIILIISSGETQPGRYQIFKEGVWEITE